MESRRGKFNTRAFVALVVGMTAPALAVTGLAGSGPAGHDHGLMGIHLGLGWLFVTFCAWHTWLNRRALGRYFRNAAVRLPPVSREAAAALALMALFGAMAVVHAVANAG